MGIRDRIKSELKRVIGLVPPEASARPELAVAPRGTPPARPAVPLVPEVPYSLTPPHSDKPTPAVSRVSAPSPVVAAPVAPAVEAVAAVAEAPSAVEPPVVAAEEPAVPAVPAPVAVAPVAPAVESPAPATPALAAPLAAKAPAASPASPLPKGILSDNDAPLRDAYLRAAFATTDASFTVRLVNEALGLDLRVPCEPGEFVLDAAERAGHELPSSCRNGGCLTCAGKLLSGDTDMEEQYTLEDEHLAEGFRLLCCTRVHGDATFVTHQQDEIHG
jgi:ferredoxin